MSRSIIAALVVFAGCGPDTIDWTEVDELGVSIDVAADPESGARVFLRNLSNGGHPCVVIEPDVSAELDGQRLELESLGAFDEGITFSQASSCHPPTFRTSAPLTPRSTSALTISGSGRSVTVQVRNLTAGRGFVRTDGDGPLRANDVASFEWTPATDRIDPSFSSLTAIAADRSWSASLPVDEVALAGGRLSVEIPADSPAGLIELRLGLLRGPAMPIEACDGAERCDAAVGRGATTIELDPIEVAP